MPIDVNAAREEYESRAGQSADKLVRKFTAATGKVEKARSPAAQKAYEDAMRDPKVLARRQKALGKVTEAEVNEAMQRKGASAYAAGVAAGADKWGRNVAPYMSELDRTVASLPARTRDPVQNVMGRVAPIAKNLNALKDKQG